MSNLIKILESARIDLPEKTFIAGGKSYTPFSPRENPEVVLTGLAIESIGAFFQSFIYISETKSLLDRLATLEKRLEALEQKKGTTIAIQNIHSEKITLSQPIFLSVNYNDKIDEYTIESHDLNIWGHGQTEQDAIDNFCEDLEDFYFELKSNANSLGKDLENKWQFLQKIIIEK